MFPGLGRERESRFHRKIHGNSCGFSQPGGCGKGAARRSGKHTESTLVLVWSISWLYPPVN